MVETNTLPLVATIASGASISDAVDMSAYAINKDNYRLFGIVMPAAWTAANLTFQASFDGGTTWNDVMDATGTEYTVTAGTSRYIPVDPTPFAAIPMLKIRSGTAAAPVNQAADRALTFILRSY